MEGHEELLEGHPQPSEGEKAALDFEFDFRGTYSCCQPDGIRTGSGD